ncbi:MAG: SH3 domain-containing protein [Lachnospiraceae bacterium]|nr:SH3 domain-containing protein [Lachnospiraceae bacterium]
MSEKDNIKDQFDILFDDIEDGAEDLKKAGEQAAADAGAGAEDLLSEGKEALDQAKEAVSDRSTDIGDLSGLSGRAEASREASVTVQSMEDMFDEVFPGQNGEEADAGLPDMRKEASDALKGRADTAAEAAEETLRNAKTEADRMIDDTGLGKEFEDIDLMALDDLIREGEEEDPEITPEVAAEPGDEVEDDVIENDAAYEAASADAGETDASEKTGAAASLFAGAAAAGAAEQAEAAETAADLSGADVLTEDAFSEMDTGTDTELPERSSEDSGQEFSETSGLTDGDAEASAAETGSDQASEPAAEGGEQTAEGAASEDEAAAAQERLAMRRQLRRESRHFWIFTALTALVVTAAVLFILYTRGIIFNEDNIPTSKVVVTTPDAETTDKPSGSESVTASDDTTASVTESEASAESTEGSADQSSSESEESTDDTSGSEGTDESGSSQEDSSPEGSSDASGLPDDPAGVLENYNNLFVISGAEMVNLRALASTDSDILAKIPEFSGGELLDTQDGWCRVNTGGFIGFVTSEYVKTGDEAKELAVSHAKQMVKVTADMLNMRAEASTDANILEPVPMGTLWEYLGDADGFYHVRYVAGMEGYLSKDYSELGWFIPGASRYYNE